MFHYVYLNKKKNLIDIRLNSSINPFNFHQHMENLGLINILIIIAWELSIKYIKVGDIVGQIDFGFNYINYNIYQYVEQLKPSDNYLELVDGAIRLKYNSIDINFTSGFLNWKQEKFPMHKAKVRSDVITSNGTLLKPKAHTDVLTALANKTNSFMVLASDSSAHPNSFKLLIPDTKSENELKYINIIETRKPAITIKPKCFQTRSYSLFIYTKQGEQYVPTHQLYLSGSSGSSSNNQKPNLKSADTEFESILYNSLPTPKYSKKELEKMDDFYKENDSNYRDLKTKAIAIDPPGSRDKDDAISFNIVRSKGKPLFLEMFVHISDVPPAINNKFNRYHFFYAFHKLETDYLYGARYPMIDPKLSESTNSLSLIGPGKRTFTVKTTYRFRPDYKTVFDVPESVEMYLEKNIKIFATTYESIALGTTDYSVDLPVNNEYVVKNKLTYNDKPVPTLNPIPCQSKQPEIDDMFWENSSQITKEDRPYIQTQLDQLTTVYGTLVRSLNICHEIKSFIQTKQYFNDDYEYNLREEWVHRLIEITALETNKYASLILYDKIKNKSWGVNNKTKLIGKLTADQIKAYNNQFNQKERFMGPIEEDEGIFRALYYGVKGYNDSPKYVKEKYIQCAPACLLSEINQMDNVTDLNNLYLKFQLDKVQGKHTPLSRLSSLASFNQTSENLGIALYSTTARPHFNTRLCYYTYFTSPMRRVVDCFVQNCLIGSEEEVKDYMGMFKRHILNRTDINAQCEKYNLFVSVCNKIFNGDKANVEFETHYIKYGTDSFNNLYLPNIDITISVSNKLNSQLQPEGKLKLIFKQITEPFDIQIIPVNKPINVKEIIDEQVKLYFQNEVPPKPGSHNYLYLNYRLGTDAQ